MNVLELLKVTIENINLDINRPHFIEVRPVHVVVSLYETFLIFHTIKTTKLPCVIYDITIPFGLAMIVKSFTDY